MIAGGGVFVINTGEFNILKVVRKSGLGYHLGDLAGNAEDEVVLSKKNAADVEIKTGDEINVFIYRDSEDKLTATLKEPFAKVGDVAYLKVVSVTNIGAFVDIGLERDVMIPRKEQGYRLEIGSKYLFYIYLDKTGRLAATTYIDKHLTDSEDYRVGDEVKGIVYGFQTNGSAMVAVDNRLRGVILKNEYYSNISLGDELTLRVKKHYEDGKMALTPRKAAVDEKTMLQEAILEYLQNHKGSMPYNDDTSPEVIKEVFHTSKKYFKNALGGLMKQRLIILDEDGTRLV